MRVDSSNPFFVFTNCPQPVLVYSTDCSLVAANKSAVGFFQRSQTDLLQLTVLDLHSPEDKQELLAELKERRTVPARTCRFRTVSGTKIARTCSYPIVAGGMEARVEIIFEDAVPVRSRYLYSRLIETLEAMPVGFYLLDRNWKVLYWNAQCETIFGVNREQVLGKDLWTLFPDAINSQYYLEYTRAMESGTAADFEEYYWPLQKWGKVNVKPLDEGLAIFFNDITAYRAAEDALKDNLEQLREVAFMYSHQMRRPVANILGLSDLLDGQQPGGIMQELNTLLRQSTRELDDIITLSNSRINSQQDSTNIRARLQVETFDFDALVREVTDEYAIKYPQHSILAACDAHIQFSGNRQAIIKLLKIVLDKAIGFSTGGCRVLAETGIEHHNLVFTVRNPGRVIPETRLREIFQAVQDLDAPEKIRTGLYHAAPIVNQHRGCMWVESSEVDGTAFYFTFPISVSNGTDQDRESSPERGFDEIELEVLEDRCLYVCARGIHDQYTIRQGCSQILSAIAENSCEGLIIDTTQVLGHWADACQMLASYFLPELEQASVCKCSLIEPTSTFGKFCMQQVISMNTTSIPLELFDSKRQAIAWHNQQA